MNDPISQKLKLSQFDQPMTKRELMTAYAISVVVMAAGLLILSKPLWKGTPLNLDNTFVGSIVALCGAVWGLCVYYRRKIPLKVKFYLSCLAFTIGGIWMAVDAEDISFHDYRHWDATAIRIVGVVCILFFGGGGLFAMYKDIRWHWEHRNDVCKDYEDKTTLTDGIISINGNDEEAIIKAINQYNLQSNKTAQPDINRYANHLRLVFHNIDYDSFCLLFNWIVYRERPAADYSARGWLKDCRLETNGNSFKGPVMFFISKEDTEHDNVCLLTIDGDCYKQEFSGSQRLKKIANKGIKFEMPK